MKGKSKKKSARRNRWLIAAGIMLIVVLSVFVVFKKYMVDSFTENSFTLYIYPQTTHQQVLDFIESKVDRPTYLRFRRLARLDHLDQKLHPGAYRLDPSMSAVEVYKIISRGLQTPIHFSFNNIRTLQQLQARIDKQLMMDSLQVAAMFQDTARIHQAGFTSDNFASMFLPDTYDMYWTITPDDFLAKMHAQYERFWNEERREKAQLLGYTPNEISILASIAEEETNDKQERGEVARLYMNRLAIGMPLQADPTVKFALQDFSIRRIVGKHLLVDSPYNTYKYAGLPPGPIRIPTKQTIDTILDSQPHDYIYMCAKEDFSGRHNFAVTFSQHCANAVKYRRALDARGIE